MDVSTPGRLRLLFLEPKSLTREKTLSRLGFSHVPLALLGLFTQRQAFDFSRSLACLFCRIRELAIAAAIASLSVVQRKVPVYAARRPTSRVVFYLKTVSLRTLDIHGCIQMHSAVIVLPKRRKIFLQQRIYETRLKVSLQLLD